MSLGNSIKSDYIKNYLRNSVGPTTPQDNEKIHKITPNNHLNLSTLTPTIGGLNASYIKVRGSVKTSLE